MKTISVKIPQDLLARVRHYAGLHRQTISELIRDGLEWRITEGDPRWQPEPDAGYFRNTVFQALAQPAYLVDENLPLDDERPATLEACEPSRSADRYSGNTTTTVPERPAEPAPQDPGNTGIPLGGAAFDPTKYLLGKLCPRQHAHGESGQSLLRISNRHCLACDREKFHERKAKRQTRPAR